MANQEVLIPSRLSDEDATWDFCSADQMGICATINLLFANQPQLFGDENTRQNLQMDIRSLITAGFKYDDFLAETAHIFRRNNINPFKNVSLCFIGADRFEQLTKEEKRRFVNSEATAPLIGLFGKTLFLNAANDPNQRFDIDTYEQLSEEEKFDFVLTGNVLNDPKVKTPLSILAACSNILKKGGYAIHLTEYGSIAPGALNFGEQYTLNKGLNGFLGQTLVSTETKFMTALRGAQEWCDLHYSAAQKTSDRITTAKDLDWYTWHIGATVEWDKLDPLCQIITLNPEFLNMYDGKLPDIEVIFADLQKALKADQSLNTEAAFPNSAPGY